MIQLLIGILVGTLLGIFYFAYLIVFINIRNRQRFDEIIKTLRDKLDNNLNN